MVYVSFESSTPKSLAQLVEELKKIQQLESNAITSLVEAIDAYRTAQPALDYWEGFLAQVLSLFPPDLVKKQQSSDRLDQIEAINSREVEDLRENVAALERELAEVRKERDDLQYQIDEAQSYVDDDTRDQIDELEEKVKNLEQESEHIRAERDELLNRVSDMMDSGAEITELQKQLGELKSRNAHLQKELEYWESQGNQLASNLIESSVGDRQSWEEEKRLIIQGFEERVQFFEKEINRYRELEKSWGIQFAHLQEEAKRNKEIAAQLNEELAKLNVDSLTSQPKKKTETYCEFVELAHNVAYLKVTETGEVLASYVGLRKVPGKKMKALANKWASYIAGIHGCKAEARESTRMKGFDWEIKITKIDMNRVRGLSKLNFSQYPDSEQDLENIMERPVFFIEEIDQFDETYPEYKVFLNDKHLWNAWKGTLTDKDGKIQRGWRTTKHRGTDLTFATLEDANDDAYARMTEAETTPESTEPEF